MKYRAVPFAVACFAAFVSFPANAASIDLAIDTSGADAVVSLLRQGSASPEEIDALMAQQRIQAVVEKVQSLDPRGTRQAYRRGMEAILSGTPDQEDPFWFASVREHLDSIEETLHALEANQDGLAQAVAEVLSAYIPGNASHEFTIVVVAGSNSCGWTTDDYPNTFFVDLRCTRDDRRGLELLVAHEVYHLIQETFFRQPTKGLPEALEKVEALQRNLISEGGASHVVDFSAEKGDGSYVDFSRREQERNRRRLPQGFALFDALVQYAAEDPEALPDNLYYLGFTGFWDSPLYYVGQEMARRIEAAHGKKTLLELWQGAAEGFALAYAALPREKRDPELLVSQRTVEVLERLKAAREETAP